MQRLTKTDDPEASTSITSDIQKPKMSFLEELKLGKKGAPKMNFLSEIASRKIE